MTKVLVHGNPETADIWELLVPALAAHGIDDVVTLSPPGFGAPTPEEWHATPESYISWLAGELEPLAETGPVDLLGHDWGSGHVFGLAAARPDLIRSWSADVSGLLHPDYEWHDAAQSWQTPGVGEEAVGVMASLSNEERAGAYAGLGLPDSIAEPMAAGFNEDMARCILELYRAAVQPALRELADRLAAAERRPSLIISALDDAYVAASLAPAVAERMGSTVLSLDGQGHWWMANDTGATAAAAGLAAFWEGLEG